MLHLTLGTSKEQTPEGKGRPPKTLKELLSRLEQPSLADFLAKDHPREWLDSEFEPPLHQAIDKVEKIGLYKRGPLLFQISGRRVLEKSPVQAVVAVGSPHKIFYSAWRS